MKTIKVQDEPNYVRDTETNAILMVNQDQYKKYVDQRAKAIEKAKEFEKHGEEIENIKQDVSEIKEMLRMLLSRNQ